MISLRRWGVARRVPDRRARRLHWTLLVAAVLLLLPALAIALSRAPEPERAADVSAAGDLARADLSTTADDPSLDAVIESSVLPFDPAARSGRLDRGFVRNPEPTVGVLSGLGLLGLAARRYRQA
jgi:hypothetical protein